MDYSHSHVRQWLKERKGLDYLVVENLLLEDSRPRGTPFHTGLLIRYVGELDSVRDSSIVLHEELASPLSEQIDKRMYVLSLVVTIFMLLSFLAGLPPSNPGGIPGGDSSWGFPVFVGMLLGAFGLRMLYLKNNEMDVTTRPWGLARNIFQG